MKTWLWWTIRGALFAPLLLTFLAHEPAQSAGMGEKVAGDSPSTPAQVKLPADLFFDKTAGAEQAVPFRHTTHVDLAEGTCVPCHPEPFRMLNPSRATSHEVMDAGRSCGTCHEGTKAFSTKDEKSCSTCHTGRPMEPVAGAAAGATRSGPKDVSFRSSKDSPGAVLFRHESHAAAGCKSCHPAAFAMKAGGTRVGSASDFHGKCGACHDGKGGFGVEDSDACQRCHAAEGAKS